MLGAVRGLWYIFESSATFTVDTPFYIGKRAPRLDKKRQQGIKKVNIKMFRTIIH
jgi:hypothetical protein